MSLLCCSVTLHGTGCHPLSVLLAKAPQDEPTCTYQHRHSHVFMSLPLEVRCSPGRRARQRRTPLTRTSSCGAGWQKSCGHMTSRRCPWWCWAPVATWQRRRLSQPYSRSLRAGEQRQMPHQCPGASRARPREHPSAHVVQFESIAPSQLSMCNAAAGDVQRCAAASCRRM